MCDPGGRAEWERGEVRAGRADQETAKGGGWERAGVVKGMHWPVLLLLVYEIQAPSRGKWSIVYYSATVRP